MLSGSSRDLGRNLDWWTMAQERNLTLVGAHISDMPALDSSAGRWTYQDEGRLFLDLLASGRLDVSDLITRRAEARSLQRSVRSPGGGWSRARGHRLQVVGNRSTVTA